MLPSYTTGEETHLPTLSWLQTHLHYNIQVQLLPMQECTYWLKTRLCGWQSNPKSGSAAKGHQAVTAGICGNICANYDMGRQNYLTMSDTDCDCISARVLSPAQLQTLCVDMLSFTVGLPGSAAFCYDMTGINTSLLVSHLNDRPWC